MKANVEILRKFSLPLRGVCRFPSVRLWTFREWKLLKPEKRQRHLVVNPLSESFANGK
jgi:hypothetical protein